MEEKRKELKLDCEDILQTLEDKRMVDRMLYMDIVQAVELFSSFKRCH